MQVPPAYPQMPPQRNSNTKLIWGIVIAVVSVCCLGVVGFGVWGFGKVAKAFPMFACAYRFEDAHLAVLHYAAAHNGTLPNAKTWQDDIQADLAEVNQSTGPGKRPFGSLKPGSDFSCLIEGTRTGIAFNSDLSGKKIADIKNASDTVLLFEIREAMKNASDSYKPSATLPPAVIGVPRGWFTAAVDGHATVEWANQRFAMIDDKFQGVGPSSR